MIEISVKVSNEEQTLVQKYIHYPLVGKPETSLMISHDDSELARLVNEAISKFKGQADDVIVKFKFVW